MPKEPSLDEAIQAIFNVVTSQGSALGFHDLLSLQNKGKDVSKEEQTAFSAGRASLCSEIISILKPFIQ